MSQTNNQAGILTAEQEEKLLQPITDYVGEIQEKIDALRKDGSDQVQYLTNHMQLIREDRNHSREEKEALIAEDKELLEKAKAVEASHKEEISGLVAKAESYLKEHYLSLIHI